MATTLDELSVKFTADISGFKSQLEKIEIAVLKVAATTDKSSKKMADSFNSLGRFIKFDILVRYGQQLLRLETQQEQYAASIKDVADEVNIGTEALQRYRAVVEENSGSAAGLDAALKKLQKSMGQARTGSEEMRKTFHALGLEELIDRGASTEEVFLGIATAFSKLKDDTAKTDVVTKLMGKSAGELVETLNLGGQKAAEFAAKMKGIIPDEMIQKLDKADEKTKAYERTMASLGATASSVWVDMVIGIGRVGEEIQREIDNLKKFDQIRRMLGTGQVENVLRGKSTRPREDPFATESKRKYTPFFQSVTPRPDEIAALNAPDPKTEKGMSDAEKAARRYAETLSDLEFQIEQLARTEQEAAFQEELRNQLSAAGVTLASAEGQAIREKVEAITALTAAGEAQAKSWEAEAAIANRAIAEMHEELRLAAEEWADFQDQAGDAVASAFADAIIYGEELEQVFARLLQQLAEMIFQKYVFDAISGAAGGGIGGVIGSVLGRAGGGPVNRSTPYMVGEHGPELFVPSMNGGIVPNGRTGGGSSFSYSPTIYAPGADASTLATMRTMLAHQKQDILSMMPKVIKESTARGRLSSMH